MNDRVSEAREHHHGNQNMEKQIGLNKEFVGFIAQCAKAKVADFDKVEKDYAAKLELKYRNFGRLFGRIHRPQLKAALTAELKTLGVSEKDFEDMCNKINADISTKFGSSHSYVWVKV